MANFGSEITPLYIAKENGDLTRLAQCRDRAFAITKSLKHHPDLQGRTSEILILEFI
jgi:hypothetical protein